MCCRNDGAAPRMPYRGAGGFTLIELLIAMVLTAVIGSVLFSTWMLVADGGARARGLVRSREAARIFWALADTDFSGLVLSEHLPRPSRTPIQPSAAWLEASGGEADAPDGTCLISFATMSSLDPDVPEGAAGPVCVEYVRRRGGRGEALIRRERPFCGVEGDFPWAEAVLLTGLADVKVRLVTAGRDEAEVPEEKAWNRAGSVIPDGLRIVVEYEGKEPEQLLIPLRRNADAQQ